MGDNQAVGYLRTSSRTNVGEDKDSEVRQRVAIKKYAAGAGLEIVDWYYDAAVSGDDAIEDRPGFNALLDRIEGNGVRIVLVEEISRFARKMMTAELGVTLLITRGVRMFDARGEDLTNSDDEMRVAFRQLAITFSQLEKARLVKKLAVARARKSLELGGYVGGFRKDGAGGYIRRGYAGEIPDVRAQARRLASQHPRPSLRAIAGELALLGMCRADGSPFLAKTVMGWVR